MIRHVSEIEHLFQAFPLETEADMDAAVLKARVLGFQGDPSDNATTTWAIAVLDPNTHMTESLWLSFALLEFDNKVSVYVVTRLIQNKKSRFIAQGRQPLMQQGAGNVVVIPVVHELKSGDIDEVTASALAAAEVQETMCNGRVTRSKNVSEPSATEIAHATVVVKKRLHANADNRGHFTQAEFVQEKGGVRLITLRGGNYDGESSGNGLAAANVGQVSMTQGEALGSTPVTAHKELPVGQPGMEVWCARLSSESDLRI